MMEKEKENDRIYLAVYLFLIVFTLLTVLSSQMQLGRSSTILLALAIATVKAGLIALYYMHLRTEKPLIYGIVLVGLITVGILAIGIFPDIGIGL